MASGTVLTSFIADDVRVENNGKMLVIGLYQQVTLDRADGSEPSTKVLMVSITDLDEGDHDISVEFRDLTGRQSIEQHITALTGTKPSNVHNLLVKMEGFTFPNSGKYTYAIKVDDDVVYRNFLTVHYHQEEQGPGGVVEGEAEG